MDQQNPTLAKIPILDTRKFKQWQFKIQQYLQHEHYALWEVIEFGDSYEAPKYDVAIGSTSEGTCKKKGRTVALTTKDMQKRKNDVKDLTQIDEDDMEEMDIKWNMALLSMRADRFWKKTGKKISIQGTDVAGFNKSKVECFNCHKIGHFARECKAPRSQDKGRRDNYRQGSKVKARLVEFKNQEVKYCEKIRGLDFKVESRANRIESLTNEIELLKKEKEGLDNKLTGFQTASKDLDNLLKSQRSDKNKEGSGYNDTVTNYSRPSHAIESTSDDLQNKNPSVTETRASPSNSVSKLFIKFVKATDSLTENKADKVETVRKTTVKYAELYRKTSKKSNACYNCGSVDHLSYNCGKWVDQGRSWEKNNNTHKSRSPKTGFHKTGRPPMRINKSYMNAAQPKRTSFYNPGHSYHKRPFQRASIVRSQFKGLRFPTVNRKFPTVNRKFPTSNSKISTADMGNKGKVVKASACWIWKPSQNLSNKGCVSFGQGGCKITGKGTIKIGKLEFENVYFVKDLKTPRQHNMYSIDLKNIVPHKDLTCLVAEESTDECMLWHRRLGHLNFKKINKLVRHNLVGGLPTKCFENDHNCTACLKGKHHKASCKTKLVNSVTKPLHTLHMDLFGPTSAEAVNTACYVQNRVLVNKSQNKTPYELFNGRTPTIGFLKPVGCHVMILNTLDNLGKFKAKGDEGTNSTNFLGTKEATGQDVKKDVSTLRYIVLPNWFHEIHLETSTSNAQDGCNADAPESSGNFNPTATSKNPLADHMETLAVETLIPTVNILRATTNTDHTNGVKADLGNMETTITASPTPTLRIHKDHLKSQIISLVDTLIQTRNKSKEMEEQSFIATIHQKTNPALLQFCLCLCFLSQVEPKKIFDALQDPSWVEAMQEELLQFKIQNVWSLVDCPKREEGIDYDEVFAHVARTEAIRLFLAYASFIGFTVYQMDVKSAFLYGTIDEEVYVMQPPGFQDPEFLARVYKVEKAMYGLHQAPRAWFNEFSSNIATALVCLATNKAKVKLLEDKKGGGIVHSGYDALIKGRSLDKGEEAAKKGSDDTAEMVTVLTSLDAATALSSGVDEVPTRSGFIPTVGPSATGIPTGSGMVPTSSPIFTTAIESTPYTRRKEEELQMMIDGLDRNNETFTKYLQEYHQFAIELPIERRIELISDLVKYQDNYAKVLTFQTQQRKPLSKKQHRDFYMSVLRSLQAGKQNT
nr:hypothetical protein [Tanacetum cinerariifolium]